MLSSIADTAGRDPFVGRSWESGELAAAVDRGRAGSGELVVVIGEAGMGKSRLVREVVHTAAGAHSAVTWVACSDAAELPAFWPWAQVVRRACRELDGSPPGIDRRALGVVVPEFGDGVGFAAGTDPVEIRSRVGVAIGDVLTVVSAVVPQVIVIDDLHWADLPSVLTLRQLAPVLARLPVTVLATYRGSEVLDAARRDLFSAVAAAARRVELGGLRRDDVGIVVQAMTGASASSGWTDSVYERTGGNPFFVKEVVRLAMAQSGDRSDLPLDAVPPSVRQVIERRVARLPDAAARLLRTAAVLGERFSVDDLARVTEGGTDVLDGLDTAARANLAAPLDAGTRFAFIHALVREALYTAMSTRERAQLHAKAGRVLEAAGASVEVVAHHLVAAAPVVGAEAAAGAAVRAGRHGLLGFAHEQAAAWFEHALQLVPGEPGALLGRAEARRQGGDATAARADLDAVIASCRRSAAPVVFARAALGVQRLGFESGHAHSEPVQLLREALAGLPDDEPEPCAQVLSALAQELHEHASGQLDEARALAAEALALAAARCPGTTVARCLQAQYAVWWQPGFAAQRAETAARMVGVARTVGDDEAEAVAHLLHGTALLELGDAAAFEVLDRFFGLADRLRLPRLGYLALTRRTALAILRGEFDAARRLLAEASDLGARVGEPDAIHVEFHLHWELARLLGDRRELLDRPLPGPQIVHVQLYGLVWPPLILLDAGRHDEAERAFADAAAVPLDDVRRDWVFLHNVSDLGEAAASLGRGEIAQRCREALAPYSGTVCVVSATVAVAGAVDHHLGALALALGDVAAAVEHLRAALVVHERLGARPWADATRALLDRALATVDASRAAGSLVREGRVWRVSWDGVDTHVPDAKGVRDLAVLLARPGTDVHATELFGAGVRTTVTDRGAEVTDSAAREAYRSRLAQLDAELADTETRRDLARAARLAVEREALIAELRRAFDLKGRPRRLGDDSERARKAVSARIRDAVTLIEHGHPRLGAHLRDAVRTGTFCGYHPAPPTRWRVRQN
ncbi:MAG: AAA family ATPase [Pseudonocardia sp.]